MTRRIFRSGDEQSHPEARLAEIISVKNWNEWDKTDRYRMAGTPSVDFLHDLAIILERGHPYIFGSLDIGGTKLQMAAIAAGALPEAVIVFGFDEDKYTVTTYSGEESEQK